MLTSAVIRLIQIPMFWLIKDFRWYLPKSLENIMKKWKERLILNDFQKDCTKFVKYTF